MSSKITPGIRNRIDAINVKFSDVVIRIREKEVESIYREGNIYKLDRTARKNFNDSDITPRIASFGPYYHGHSSCVSTQERKELVLVHFLKRSGKRLDHYIEVLLNRITVRDLKNHYDKLDLMGQHDDDSFLWLMILDGFFFLEVSRETSKLFEADLSGSYYNYDSPVWGINGFNNIDLREHYLHDMLLLENQIPMVVLYKLCEVEYGTYEEACAEVNNSICRLPSPLPWARDQPRGTFEIVVSLYRDNLLDYADCSQSNNLKYLFGLVIHCFSDYFKILFKLVISYFRSNSTSATELRFNIPSATELEKVGIRFTTSETMKPSDVWFSGRTLALPPIYMDGATKSIFVNIIALEGLYDLDKKITSYVYLMNKLLRREDDVKLLESHGIIHSAFNGNEIIEVFDNVTIRSFIHNPDILDHRYKLVGGNLRKCYNKRSKGWQRDLWQNYLRSPFGIVSVIAAFFLFALTFVQTVYTILGYYKAQ